MTFRLHYFRGRGQAEGIRLALVLAEVEWEDVFLSKRQELENLLNEKKLLFGQVPMLEVPDDAGNPCLVQTGAILRHLARRFPQLYGNEELCDMVIEAAADLAHGILGLPFERITNDTIAKSPAELREAELRDIRVPLGELRHYYLPKFGASFEAILAEFDWLGGGPRGGTATVADAAVFPLVEDCVDYLGEDCLAAYPLLAAWRLRFLSLKSVDAFIHSDRRLPSLTNYQDAQEFSLSVRRCLGETIR
eukprot:gnl/TRDRNA2_/TRDRNA2_81737_c0_seq1.p1 gnl/TRDRNA2_/TRDRNA2_81737_c0~~gnl/TRDRNA2_/TRDRNA2_81737_c0_seq1.p1  ORF type:complete len:249 (+),score=47.44 gnl/TRDRNA2_/TRDRNA2_81737_c0_seq1:67-813(+)